MARSSAVAPATKKQIALLHVAKRELGLTDDDYRAILARHGHCNSSADLNASGFTSVMKYMAALGFKSTSATPSGFGERRGMASPAQIDLIRALWLKYHGEADDKEAALNNWLTRFHKVSALRFVDVAKASKIITALKRMTSRKKNES
ncbi:regulatory protein GemA [Rhizobium rosettiformans]|uniref:Regulatory protein GemA n=1 Tax=Rhizobium rosettiformans TaxID=1368430 RepID=A0ABX7F0W8_9HYPH|nr:regulatory protein GemA [Rhizobium rosettiformans]QRF53840.1 regulatory protein GemA [Rhizobium rosettiformans]